MSDARADTTDAGRCAESDAIGTGLAPLAARSAIGGVLMGMANLVPGISGGTMLLAAGVYPNFINAVAEVTTLRFRLRSLVSLGAIAVCAGLAIALLAGPVKSLVVEHRWIMYSLFIGLTLGGVPVVWRLARGDARAGGRRGGLIVGAVIGLSAMSAMLLIEPGRGGGQGYALLFIAGLAGASAMVLPGVSGGYLLLLLGQYVPILGSIDRTKEALGAGQYAAAAHELYVFVPVGLGVVLGIVGVSNAIRWLLRHQRQPTLGVLLGLLLGAVPGIWPFQEGVQPEEGQTIKGELLTEQTAAQVDPDDWPTALFTPSITQIGGSVVLIGTGFALTVLISGIGGRLGGSSRVGGRGADTGN